MDARSPFDLALRIPNFDGYSPPESGSGNSTPHRVVGFPSTKATFSCKTPTSVLRQGPTGAPQPGSSVADAVARHSSLTDLLLQQGVPRPGTKLSIKIKRTRGSENTSGLRRSRFIAVADLGSLVGGTVQQVDRGAADQLASSSTAALPAETLPSAAVAGNNPSVSVVIPRPSHTPTCRSVVDEELVAAALQGSPYGTPGSPSDHFTADSLPTLKSEPSSYGTPSSNHSWLTRSRAQHAQQQGKPDGEPPLPQQTGSEAYHATERLNRNMAVEGEPSGRSSILADRSSGHHGGGSSGTGSGTGSGTATGTSSGPHRATGGGVHAHPSASTSCLEGRRFASREEGLTTRQLFQARAEATTSHAQVECLREALIQEQLKNALLEKELERVTLERDRLKQQELRRQARGKSGRQGEGGSHVGSWPPLGRLQLPPPKPQPRSPFASTAQAAAGSAAAGPAGGGVQGGVPQPQQGGRDDGSGGGALPSTTAQMGGAYTRLPPVLDGTAGAAGAGQWVGDSNVGAAPAAAAAVVPLLSPRSGSSMFELLSTLSMGPAEPEG